MLILWIKTGPMAQQMDELNERLFGVITDSLKIKNSLYDREVTAELYNNISIGFMESPDLRVTWMQSLAVFHKQVRFSFEVSIYDTDNRFSILFFDNINSFFSL